MAASANYVRRSARGPARCRAAGPHSRLDGDCVLCPGRGGPRRSVRLGLPRRGPADEPPPDCPLVERWLVAATLFGARIRRRCRNGRSAFWRRPGWPGSASCAMFRPPTSSACCMRAATPAMTSAPPTGCSSCARSSATGTTARPPAGPRHFAPDLPSSPWCHLPAPVQAAFRGTTAKRKTERAAAITDMATVMPSSNHRIANLPDDPAG